MSGKVPIPYRWIIAWVNPKLFFLGLICSFTMLIMTGRNFARINLYGWEFKRFHSFLVPESLYYPTASQFYALARDQVYDNPQKAVAVIVSGTSVMYGFGQSVDKLWTEELQRELGEPYRVLNLALPGATTTEGGALTVQSLIKNGYKKVIYIADAYPLALLQPDGFSVNKYIFWDAYYKGLLLQTPKLPIHDQLFNPSEPELDNKLLSRLDSLFYFNDFWTTVAYQNIFTVWNYTASGGPQGSWSWLKPRKRFRDDIVNGQGSHNYVYPDSLLENVLNSLSLRNYCNSVYYKTQNGWQPVAQFWHDFNLSIQKAMPQEIKTRTIILVLQYSPYYTTHSKLSSNDKLCIKQGVLQTTQLYQKNGFTALNTGGQLSELDYADHIHLAPTGGNKLAKIIAPAVKRRAAALGYLSSEH